MEALKVCLDGTGGHFAPFLILLTGMHTGRHREKPRPRPPSVEPELANHPELQDLLVALGDLPAKPATEKPAREILSDELSGQFDGARRSDIELKNADLAGFSTLPYFNCEQPCWSLDISGDFSWSDLSGSQFASGASRLRDDYPVILSGWFIGANLSKCRFSRAHLAGDFSWADFRGAEFINCKLTGRFNGAVMPIQLQNCKISPEASFKGADLRGATASFPEPDQIRAAQINPIDDITVGNGSTVTIRGREYGLLRPAQLLRNVIIPGIARGSRHGSKLPLAVVQSHQTLEDNPWLFDVSKADSENLAGWSKETSRHKIAWGFFYLNAPDATLRGIMAGSSPCRVVLIGNFDRARLMECEVHWLEVREGSFRHFDLTHAVVDKLWLHISKTDLTGIRLPDVCKKVEFQCEYRNDEFRFETPPSQAEEIIEAWNSPQECAALAERSLSATQAFTEVELLSIRKSGACTVDGFCRVNRHPDPAAEAFLALTARKNQLLLAPALLSGRER